jgi:hypothetical protein
MSPAATGDENCPWRKEWHPPRTTTWLVLKTGKIKVHHVIECNELSISHIEHSMLASISSVVAGVRGVNLGHGGQQLCVFSEPGHLKYTMRKGVMSRAFHT